MFFVCMYLYETSDEYREKNNNAQTHIQTRLEREMHRNNLTQQNQNKTTQTNTRLVVVVVVVVVFLFLSSFWGGRHIWLCFLAQRKLSGRTAARKEMERRWKRVKSMCTIVILAGCLFCTSMRPLVDLAWLCSIKSQLYDARHACEHNKPSHSHGMCASCCLLFKVHIFLSVGCAVP